VIRRGVTIVRTKDFKPIRRVNLTSSGRLDMDTHHFPSGGLDPDKRRTATDSTILYQLNGSIHGGLDLNGKFLTALGTLNHDLLKPIHGEVTSGKLGLKT
jgi:hypothetical protein